MKKVLKCLAILAAIGVVIGLVITFLYKNKEEEALFVHDSEDEDFDLDSDLQAPEREYVPLKKAEPEENPEAPAEPTSDPSI